MTWFEIDVESVTRGTVYIEASSAAQASAIIVNAPLEQAMMNQIVREAIKEKIKFTPLSIKEQTDFNEDVLAYASS